MGLVYIMHFCGLNTEGKIWLAEITSLGYFKEVSG